MAATATAVFEFLRKHRTCAIETREVFSGRFSLLRHNLRTILVAFLESGDTEALDIARRLRATLSEWLTSPVVFDEQLVNAIGILGTPFHVEQRWGRGIREAYQSATDVARVLSSHESTARVELLSVLRQARLNRQNFRIYCHRRAVPHFQSLAQGADVEPLQRSEFIHTPREYREAEPFEVLVKFGPLRALGWGAVPDSLLSAPRFQSLLQVRWSGCLDESTFGYDPVGSPDGHSQVQRDGKYERPQHGGDGLRWTMAVTRIESDSDGPVDDIPPVDELELFREMRKDGGGNRKVMVAQIDGEYGMALPLHAQVLSLDPMNSDNSVDYRLPIETLREGMYIVKVAVDDLDLGGLQTGEGRYSRIWKQKLRDHYETNPDGLCTELRDGGVHLLQLRSCIEHWCRPASTVIHAPQQRRHFEILIRVLGIDPKSEGVSVRNTRVPWWQMAWREIAHARGEAIQSGMHEQKIVDEQVIDLLRSRRADVQRELQTGDEFRITVRGESSLQGEIRFLKIRSLESGYEVPETMIDTICELRELEQWRV